MHYTIKKTWSSYVNPDESSIKHIKITNDIDVAFIGVYFSVAFPDITTSVEYDDDDGVSLVIDVFTTNPEDDSEEHIIVNIYPTESYELELITNGVLLTNQTKDVLYLTVVSDKKFN